MTQKSRSSGMPVFLVIVLGVLIALSYLVPEGVDAPVIWPCLIIFYIVFWDAIRRPTRIHPDIPTFITVEVLFLIFYYILFFMPYQLAMLNAFDLSRSIFLKNTFESGSNQAVAVSTLGLVAFYMGIKKKNRTRLADTHANRPTETYKYLPLLTLFALVGLILIYQLSGWRSAGEGRYTGTTSGGVLAEGVSLLILMFSLVAIAIPVARTSQRRRITAVMWLAMCPAVYWGLRILLTGDRNSFLLLAIVGLGGLFTFRFKASRISLIGMLLGALILYNAIEVARMAPSAGLGDIVSAATTSSEDDSDSSFNISTVSVRAALQIVPSSIDYGYGIYKVIGVAGIIPLVRGFVISSDQAFTTTSGILGYGMLGPNATWGVGTNVISDIYIDFGILGIPIVMYLLGWFAGAVRDAAMRSPLATGSIIIYLITLALFAELPRYAVDFPVRLLAWAALMLWVYRLLSRSSSSATDNRLAGKVELT